MTILEMRILHLERLNCSSLQARISNPRPKSEEVYILGKSGSFCFFAYRPLDPIHSKKVIYTPLEPRWGQKADRLISNPGQRFFRADTGL